MPDQAGGHRQYIINIAWSWLGVATGLLSSTIITPILIRRLGTAQFGIWALAASLVEYLWLLDLGLRPAVVKLTAEFRALNRDADINQLLNTGMAYSAVTGGVLLLLAWPNAEWLGALLHITDPAFPFLVRAVAVSWALGMVFNTFSAVIEGFQRFDLSNRIEIVSMFLRSNISLVLVLMGYGLRQMGTALLIAQGVAWSLTYLYCRHIYPDIRISLRYCRRSTARTIIRYAGQLISGMLGARLTQATLPASIAYFRPVQFVTYYTQSVRILEYAGDAAIRIGLVTLPRASDLVARGRIQEVIQLTIYGNRYCMTLFGLLGSFLFVYGGDVCSLWITPEFGRYAGTLLPILAVGFTLWYSQSISGSVLMGTGKYREYSVALLLEAIATSVAFMLLLPRFGLVGAVIALAANMTLTRCVFLSHTFASKFGLKTFPFLIASILRPLCLITASILLLFGVRYFLGESRGWIPVLTTAILFAIMYSTAAVLFVLDRRHRMLLIGKLRTLGARLRPAEAAA